MATAWLTPVFSKLQPGQAVHQLLALRRSVPVADRTPWREGQDWKPGKHQGFHSIAMLFTLGGEKLISRSQAKRIVARLNRFREVVFDFEGVDSIGPAFADEIFRVFQSQYPDIHLAFVNTCPEVTRMIQRAFTAGEEVAPPGSNQAPPASPR